MRKSDGVRVHNEKKSDGVRVHHEKKTDKVTGRRGVTLEVSHRDRTPPKRRHKRRRRR